MSYYTSVDRKMRREDKRLVTNKMAVKSLLIAVKKGDVLMYLINKNRPLNTSLDFNV